MHDLYSSRNTACKMLAYALADMFPGAWLAGGEISDIGFHYTFVISQTIDEQLFPLIEEKMRFLIKEHLPIKKMEMVPRNAAALFEHHKQPLLAEKALEKSDTLLEVVHIGPLYDLLEGPITQDSSTAGCIKLLKLERAVVKNHSGFRIEGTAFPDAKALKHFLKVAEAAKKRDHRLLGVQMDLFSFDEAGACAWHPKGMWLREKIENLGTESGFQPIESSDPLRIVLSKPRSYQELPIRYSQKIEIEEKNKKSWGLFLAPHSHCDCEEIFCIPEEVEGELISSLHFINKTIKIFGFEYQWYLQGTPAKWEKSLHRLVKALESAGVDYTHDKEGRAAHGPRVEMRIKDALGREWCGPSLSIESNFPNSPSLRYRGSDDKWHQPAWIRRSVFGSIERFVGLLLEQYSGQFPLWLAPEQVRVVPLGPKNWAYAHEIYRQLQAAGYRVGINTQNVSLGSKVHEAEKEHIPYVVIVGDKEETQKAMTLRSCYDKGAESQIELSAFLEHLGREAVQSENRRLERLES